MTTPASEFDDPGKLLIRFLQTEYSEQELPVKEQEILRMLQYGFQQRLVKDALQTVPAPVVALAIGNLGKAQNSLQATVQSKLFPAVQLVSDREVQHRDAVQALQSNLLDAQALFNLSQ